VKQLFPRLKVINSNHQKKLKTPKRKTRLKTTMINQLILIEYSGFLFPSFLAFLIINKIKIPDNPPETTPPIEITVTKPL